MKRIKPAERYFLCSENNKGGLEKELDAPTVIMCLFFFWVIPFAAIGDLIARIWRHVFYVTEKDFLKEKLKELE